MKGLRATLKPLYRLVRRGIIDIFRWLGQGSERLGPPVALYSTLDHPEDVHLILPGQESRPVAPDCLRIRCGFRQHLRQPWPIFWQKIAPARLVGPSLAVMGPDKRLMVESVYDEHHGLDDPSYNYLYLPPAAHLGGAWTSVLSRWFPATSGSYYHWLMDALPRLALLEQFPTDTGILVTATLTSFQRETLEILNLTDRCRPTPETHLIIENYYHSSFTAMTGCDNPYAISFLRGKFLSAASPTAPRHEKVYISRLNSARRAHNEEAIVSILQDQGWAIIETQDYSFREQVALFSHARAICATHGAGLTNLLWCPKGAKVLELCPENFLNGCYESLAAHLDLDYRYLVFPADSNYRMQIDVDRFTAALADMDRA